MSFQTPPESTPPARSVTWSPRQRTTHCPTDAVPAAGRLAKAWRHRLSFDLDITIPTSVSRYAEQTVLETIETELRKQKLDVTHDPTERLLRAKTGVVDKHGNEGGIDIWVHDPGLPGSAPPELIAGTPVNRLSAAQIIHGKLQRDRSALG